MVRPAARWQAALPDLLAALPPATRRIPDYLTPEAGAAALRAWKLNVHPRLWLEQCATYLSPADIAAWHLLRVRAEALEGEAAALAALLAAIARPTS